MMSTSILILIVAKALPSIQKQISSIHFIRLVSMILIISGLLSFNTLYIQSIGSGIGIYSGLFQITTISQTIEIFLLVIGSLILIGWPHEQSKYSVDYSLITLFSILGSSLLISSFDLLSFYLSLELQSFGLYILSTLYRNSESSTNAGLKYFLLGGLSSCIILLGTGIIYAYTGLTQLESIYMLILTSNIDYIIFGTLFGLVLILIGLLFKISAAPLHNWSPDVYDETPTIVTIWLTIVPKISLLIFILVIMQLLASQSDPSLAWVAIAQWARGLGLESTPFVGSCLTATTYNSLSQAVGSLASGCIATIELKNLLLISSILSLIIGTVVGLAQEKIKRLLTYSTISHIGFMLLAIAINTNQSIDSFLFYLIQYIITNLNIFLILLAISYIPIGPNSIIGSVASCKATKSKLGRNATSEASKLRIIDVKYLTDLKGLFYVNPFLSLSLSLSLFSMAGIPPFVGFFSKQFVLYSALDAGYYFISLIGIIVSVISASYYLKIIKLLHLPNFNLKDTSAIAARQLQHNMFLSNKLIELQQQEEELIAVSSSCLSCPKGCSLRQQLQTTADQLRISQFHSFLIALLSLFILLFILKPTLILNSTQILSLSLFKL